MAARVRAAGGDLYSEARFLHNWTELAALASLERRLTRPDVVTELSFSNGATRPWREVLATRREAGDRRRLTLLLAPASTFAPDLEELRRDWGASVRLEPLADTTLAVVVPE